MKHLIKNLKHILYMCQPGNTLLDVTVAILWETKIRVLAILFLAYCLKEVMTHALSVHFIITFWLSKLSFVMESSYAVLFNSELFSALSCSWE